jgi:hypothetical protein
MALDIDGFAVLGLIGRHPSVFSEVQMDVDKQARALVGKQIKQTGDLSKLREVRRLLGLKNFNLIVDGLEVAALLKRLDKANPVINTGDARWQRQHLIALADGSQQPTPPALKQSTATRSRKAAANEGSSSKKPNQGKRVGKAIKETLPSQPEVIDYSSAGAKRQR